MIPEDSTSPSTPIPPEGTSKPKRRVRYGGTHPRRFDQKYKEHQPEKYPETIQKVVASGKTPAGMHRPVMLQEVLEYLKPSAGEIGVDCTLGYGGHTEELWKAIQPNGRLFAFDVDPMELPRTESRLRTLPFPPETLVVSKGNFAGLSKTLAAHGTPSVDFLLADLGVSSMQIDNPSRGFTFKQDGPLDLRMNPNKGLSAAEWIRKADRATLEKALLENADEPHAAKLAQALCEASKQSPVDTTRKLVAIVDRTCRQPGSGKRGDEALNSTLQRVFQALRIAVNEEFNALESLLRQLPDCLRAGGRVAILTFHSGEDRRVKQAFEEHWRRGWLEAISETVVRPSAEECRSNPRARCAKLRWAIRSARTTPTIPALTDASDPLEHPLVEFRNSVIHGTGGFARVPIQAGSLVIEYLGERISKAESLRRCMQNNQFVFSLDDHSDLDGDVPWNPARFLNHSCDPSCEAEHREGHIWIVAKRDIQPGEELSFNYGFDFDHYQDYPCQCGSPKCVGFIVAEEFHDRLRQRISG